MLIITPNRRLAAFSNTQFAQQQVAKQQQSWESAEIYALKDWILQLWQLCLEAKPECFRPLLSDLQQQQLVAYLLQQSDTAMTLLRLHATAQNVIQAWTFMQQWQLPLQTLEAYSAYAPDSAAFVAWMQQYLQWLDANDYYDYHLMVDCLIANLKTICKHLPATVCLRGFTEITPQYTKFFAALELCGVDISADQLIAPVAETGAQLARCGFVDNLAEYTAAARWAALQLQENPQQCIGIVVPELEQQRTLVSNIFAEHLPHAWVNISAPLPLTSYAVIDTALLILEAAKPTLSFNEVSILLRSPFVLGNIGAANQHALLDRTLRDKLEVITSWKMIFAAVATLDLPLASGIAKFIEKIDALQGQHGAEYWVHYMQELLACWGWPNLALQERACSGSEADLLSCWRDLLTEYSRLGIFLENHSFASGLQMLHRIASETPFLPAETGLTKVHVLGVLEADGIAFDQLWVTGMTRDSWPMEASPNPFIPLELQREFDLPRSTPQRELHVAQRLTANLQQGGKRRVIFSHALMVAEQPMAPSNLIRHIPEITVPLPAFDATIVNCDLETWRDDLAPPLDNAYVSGGISVLKLQAQCPFKAYAEIRLLAKPLVDPQLYLNAAERGSLVHAVLEDFWRRCKSHAQLLQWQGPHLTVELTTIIAKILQQWQLRRPFTMTKTYVVLEAQRLLKLLQHWLNYEALRDPFVVAQLEQKMPIQVGPLQINMQIDRIDQLTDNTYVIIDYKTGAVLPSEWHGDPLYDPQLPLYAVYAADQIAAVAVGVLQPNRWQFYGISATEKLLPNVRHTPNWQQLKQQWQTSLQMTASEFMQGIAAVDPYSNRVCNYCKLQALCRIYD